MQKEIRESSVAQRSGSQFRPKLLIVDENLDDLLYYSRVLQRAAYDVRCIASFTDGATSLENESFDLIIISQGSPNFAGRSVLAWVSDQHRQTPVLVLDRYADSARYLEAMHLGAQDYLERPLQPSEIATLVASSLAGSVGRGKKQPVG
jgi:DNA-binding NtrC family response regulator